MKYLIILGRSAFFYALIGILYRMMGKREVAELSIMDLIVSIFIAQLASIAIENYNNSMLISIIPIAVLVSFQLLSSYLEIKSHKVKEVVDGKISVIINRGRIDFDELENQRYGIEDLLVELRTKGIKSIEDVDYAILETNGKLSIFEKKDDQNSTYPLPVIIDGRVEEDTLIEIGETSKWLNNELLKDNLRVEDIFYAFYKNNNLFIITRDNIK
ncbi:MAG: DUF421 domain-containing protein [Bacilli bacterium]|nr:DUF421 domain-containing protein [Bacilli bacterium]